MASSNLGFMVQTLDTVDGRSVGSVTPDHDGYYTVPLGIFGKPSQNNKRYDDVSLKEAMTNPNTSFYKKITTGGLFGEFGHPLEDTVNRIIKIDETRVSHFIKQVWTKTTSDGLMLVMGKVKPWGPYGQYVEQSFSDKDINTAFSLRSLVGNAIKKANINHVKVLALITYDYVGSPGFKEASKRYSDFVAKEDFYMPINPGDLYNQETFTAMESIANQEILDYLKVNELNVYNSFTAMYDQKQKCLNTSTGKKSLFHSLYK